MFVGRQLDGSIYGAWTTLQPNDADHLRIEELPDNHPDVVAFLAPKPIDFSNVDNLEKGLKAIALLFRNYTNALQAGTHTQKTIAQLRSDFKTIFDSLP
jgi:hypothetical protein